MRSSVLAGAILAAAVTAVAAAYANAQEFHAKFSGFNEVGGVGAGQTGAIFSQGQATLALKLNSKLQSLNYTLTYSGLSAPVTQAHRTSACALHMSAIGGKRDMSRTSQSANDPNGHQLVR